MRDYSKFPAPREAVVGGSLISTPAPGPNRNLVFGMVGCALLCLCLGLLISPILYSNVTGNSVSFGPIQYDPNGARGTQTTSPRATATATPRSSTLSTGQATPVPYSRSSTASDGLKLTVTYWQRPLPAQGVKIPDGQELALVSLHLENTATSGDPIKIRPNNFYLVTPENEQYNPSAGGVTSGGTMLTAMDLKPSATFDGDLIYYIRTDVQNLSLAWKSADGVRLFALQRGN